MPGRILFVTWDGGGNVPPVLALGTRLQARGKAKRSATCAVMHKLLRRMMGRLRAFYASHSAATLPLAA